MKQGCRQVSRGMNSLDPDTKVGPSYHTESGHEIKVKTRGESRGQQGHELLAPMHQAMVSLPQ